MYIIVLIIIAFVGFIVVSTIINNLKHRATQHVLGKVGLGGADINASLQVKQEQGALRKLFSEYPNLNEQLVKDSLFAYSQSLVNLQNNGYMSQKVLDDMVKDNNLMKMRTMNFVRINVLAYRSNKMSVITVYTDGRDEYQIMMTVSIQNQSFYLENYDAMRGMSKGF